eukprot:749354-Hanusia_phi.AAC.3
MSQARRRTPESYQSSLSSQTALVLPLRSNVDTTCLTWDRTFHRRQRDRADSSSCTGPARGGGQTVACNFSRNQRLELVEI